MPALYYADWKAKKVKNPCLLDAKIRAVAEMISVFDRIVVFPGAGVSTESGIPDCGKCHGILKPDIVFFGEALPSRAKDAAIKHSGNWDLLIAIGSFTCNLSGSFYAGICKRSRCETGYHKHRRDTM